MRHDADNDVHQIVLARVPGLVSRQGIRLIAFYVLGADGRTDKDEFILEIAAVQDFGGH